MKRNEFMLRIWWLNIGNNGAMCGMHIESKTVVYRAYNHANPSTLDTQFPLQWRWRHNGHDGVWNHQPHDCLLSCSFRIRLKKTSKLHVTGLCAGNSPVTGEFPAQMASNAKNVSIWWRHHASTWHMKFQTSLGWYQVIAVYSRHRVFFIS